MNVNMNVDVHFLTATGGEKIKRTPYGVGRRPRVVPQVVC